MSEIQRVLHGFVVAVPLSHDGSRYTPGMPIDLDADQAVPLLARGLIHAVYHDFVVDDPASVEPLPESAYPADAKPVTKTRKGVKA